MIPVKCQITPSQLQTAPLLLDKTTSTSGLSFQPSVFHYHTPTSPKNRYKWITAQTAQLFWVTQAPASLETAQDLSLKVKDKMSHVFRPSSSPYSKPLVYWTLFATLLVAIISMSIEGVWVSSLPEGRDEEITQVIIKVITFGNSKPAANFWQLARLTQVLPTSCPPCLSYRFQWKTLGLENFCEGPTLPLLYSFNGRVHQAQPSKSGHLKAKSKLNWIV